MTAFLSMALALFCSHLLRMQPVYRIRDMGLARCIMTDYVVSFNLVNCPSKTFSPIYAIHCPLSFFHPRIFFYPSTLSTLYYVQFRPVEYLQPRTPQANLDFLTNPGLPRKLLLCILCLSGLCFSFFLLLFVTVVLVCLCYRRASSGKKN